MPPNKIILAGGSGFLGQVLAKHLSDQGFEIGILTRAPKPRVDSFRELPWDGKTHGAWVRELDGAAVVINLAGRSVDCRYHPGNRKLIMDSRVDSTRALGTAISQCSTPPPVWLNSSTATIYRHSFDRPMDESTGEIGATPEAADAFSVEVARAWEQALDDAPTPRTRKVALRTAMVLGTGRNSVLPVMRHLVRFGLGGPMASGRQYMSWIHQADFCGAIDWLIKHENLFGPVNLATPNPVPNCEFMKTLRDQCGVPFGIPSPRWMLEIGAILLRTETELIIKSRRVIPGKLQTSGFEFRFPQLAAAVADLWTNL
jgi:uncharacterized protein (TIGR01777 family)